MIFLYKEKPLLEKWLASEIIIWQIRRYDYLHNNPTPVPQQPLISAPPAVHRPPELPVPTSVQTPSANPDTMPDNLTDRYRQIANSCDYCQPGQPVGLPARYFQQIRYLPIPNAVLDLDKALSGAWLTVVRTSTTSSATSVAPSKCV